MTKIHSVASLLLMVALAAGCGQSVSKPVLLGSEQPAPGFAGLLPFPVDRQLAALSTTSIDGQDSVSRSAGAVDDGPSSVLISATADPEYALYTFNPLNTPNQVTVTIDNAQTTAYWIALANYALNRWELDGPYASSQSFALNASYLSPLGNCSIVVLAPPGESVKLDLLQLSANNDPPVADITASADGPAPLTVNFDANGSTDLEGPITDFAWEYETGGGFTSTGTTAVSTHNYLVQGVYTARVRVTDAGGLVAFDSVAVTAGAPINTPPVAQLTGPADAAAPMMANFDASGSSDPDPDDSITNYSWDLDNDRAYNSSPAENAVEGDAAVSLNLTDPGSYTVNVRVYDETGGLGGTDTASFTVVAAGWRIFTLSTEGDESGRLNSLAVINGKPAIAYMTYDGAQVPPRVLRYAYSATDTGSQLADWTSVALPTVVNGGQAMSLLEVAGNPAISCYGGPTAPTAFRLAYVRSTTASGASSSDWETIQPDTSGVNFGFVSSLAIVSGNPAIAYQGLNDDTCYIRSSTADGMSASDWGMPIAVDGAAGTSGNEVSLVVAGGNPAIAYRDQQGTLEVRYARASNTTGEPASAWTGAGSTLITLDAACFFPSMAIVNGNPAIAYWDSTNLDLKYAYSATASGSTLGDWTMLAVDGGPDDCGVLPSLAVINGVPAICHQSQGAEFDLEFNRANTSTGSLLADWPADGTKVDEPGDVGGYCTMKLVNGFAAICYFDNSPNNSMKYAVLFE